VNVVLKETYSALDEMLRIAAAVGVSRSGEKGCAANPKMAAARTVAVVAVVVGVSALVVVVTVALRGPTSWFGAVLNPASVGMIDDKFVKRGVAPVTALAGRTFVPGMGCINDGLPSLHGSTCGTPKIASSKYATRDPAVRPMLYDSVMMLPEIIIIKFSHMHIYIYIYINIHT
jgi:hypothetical protein